MTELQASSDIHQKPTLVQIIELQEETVNPTPLCKRSPAIPCEDILTEQKLREITGVADLSMVFTLDLEIDTDRVSVANFGSYLPNLRYLRLSNSNIHAVRDLGTNLNSVEVIWMPRCNLVSLNGLSGFTKLVELYIAFNGVSDLSPCAMLDNIEVLDLEGNLIEDKTSLSYLRLCHNLTSLTLEGNPFVTKYGGKIRYRKIVRKEVPQITILDDIPIQDNPKSHSGEYDITKFDSEWEYIDILLKEIGLLSVKAKNFIDGDKSSYRLATAETIDAGRSTLGLKSTSALKQKYEKNTSQFTEPKFSQRSLRLSRSSSVMLDNEVNYDEEERVSELTTGKIICGGISSALRHRRSSANKSDIEKTRSTSVRLESKSGTSSILDDNGRCKVKTENANQTEPNSQQDDKVTEVLERETTMKEELCLRKECENVFQELAEWRKLHTESKLHNSNKNTTRKKDKSMKTDLECKRIISSPDSDENTPNDLVKECNKDMIMLNKPLNNYYHQKSNITNKKKSVKSNDNRNCENIVPMKMSNIMKQSQIDMKHTNVGTSCVNNRSVVSNDHATNHSQFYSSSSYSAPPKSVLSSIHSSDLPIPVNSSSSSFGSPPPPSTSTSSPNRHQQHAKNPAAHIDCFYDEQLIVDNEHTTQGVNSQNLSSLRNKHQRISPEVRIFKSSSASASSSTHGVVNPANRIHSIDTRNKFALKFTKTLNKPIQPLPSKPLVKHEK
ncbi:unnamed protein product [Schistosoma turkestanicum]|nr:unnamed protein product [Schistosoma turkestanicum]